MPTPSVQISTENGHFIVTSVDASGRVSTFHCATEAMAQKLAAILTRASRPAHDRRDTKVA